MLGETTRENVLYPKILPRLSSDMTAEMDRTINPEVGSGAKSRRNCLTLVQSLICLRS